MNTKLHDENVDFLFDAILALENREECYRFFEDLCTVPELKANWFGSTRAMIRAAGALSEDDRRSVMRMLRLLMQSAIGELSGADKETAKA